MCTATLKISLFCSFDTYYLLSLYSCLSILCQNEWLYNEVAMYCDLDYRVDCGDRPLCDENDDNCEDREYSSSSSIELVSQILSTQHASNRPSLDHISTPAPPMYCSEDEVDATTWVDCSDSSNEGVTFPAEPCGPVFCTCSNGDPLMNVRRDL